MSALPGLHPAAAPRLLPPPRVMSRPPRPVLGALLLLATLACDGSTAPGEAGEASRASASPRSTVAAGASHAREVGAPAASLPPGVPADLPADVAAIVARAHDAVRAQPTDVAARLQLAMVLDANALHGAAAQQYEQVLAVQPEHAEALYHLAVCRDLLGDTEGALEAAGRAAALTDYAPAHGRRGQWLLDAGRLDEAEGAFLRAAASDPGHPVGPEGLARVALARGDPDAATELLRDWLARHPDRRYARFLLGTALRDAGRLDEAAPLLVEGAGASLGFPDPWRAQVMALAGGITARLDEAVALGRRGQGGEALDDLLVLHRADPADVAVLEKLVGACLAARRPELALQAVAAGQQAQPRHPRPYFLAAIVHEEQGDLPAALAAVGEALERDGRWPPARELAARLHWKAGDLPGAARELEAALALQGEDVENLLKLARARALLDEWEAARDAAARAAAARPESVPAWVALAEAQLALDDGQGCAASLQQALALAPGDEKVAALARRAGLLPP